MPESSVQLLPLILPIVISVIILLILGLIIFVCCRRQKSRSRSKRIDHEMEHLLDTSKQPLSFNKAFHYGVNNVFCKTKCFTEAVGILQIFHCVTLIGPPGSGKTITAVQLAGDLCRKNKKAKIHFCQTLGEIIAAAKLEDACLVVDGCLDHYLYYPSKVIEDLKELNRIFTECVKRETIHIIFTVQLDRWHALGEYVSDCGMFNKKHCLLMNNETLSETDLKNMIENHFKYHKILLSSKKDTKSETNLRLPRQENLSLPLMVDLICKNKRLMLARDRIVSDGFKKILTCFFNTWLSDEDSGERESFCILVFAALRGGIVSFSDFESSVIGPIYKEVCRQFNCKTNTENVPKLLKENERLTGCLFHVEDSTEDDPFVFHHEWLLHFVLQFVTQSKGGETFLIKNANVDLLLSKCWIEDEILDKFIAVMKNVKRDPPIGSVCLSTSTLNDLVRRINSEMLKGFTLHERLKHVFWDNKLFRKEWDRVCVNVDTKYSNEDDHRDPRKLGSQDKSKDEEAAKKIGSQTDYSDTKSKVTDSNASEIESKGGKVLLYTRSSVHKDDGKTKEGVKLLTPTIEVTEPTSTNGKVTESDSSEIKGNPKKKSSQSKKKSKTKEPDTKKPTDSGANENDSSQNAPLLNNDQLNTGTVKNEQVLKDTGSVERTSQQTKDEGSAV